MFFGISYQIFAINLMINEHKFYISNELIYQIKKKTLNYSKHYYYISLLHVLLTKGLVNEIWSAHKYLKSSKPMPETTTWKFLES